MPQMSPIMWNYFIFFILLMILSTLVCLSFEVDKGVKMVSKKSDIEIKEYKYCW